MTTRIRKNKDHSARKRGSGPGPAQESEQAIEEDLHPRDAREMPREPQNPVNPNPETAS